VKAIEAPKLEELYSLAASGCPLFSKKKCLLDSRVISLCMECWGRAIRRYKITFDDNYAAKLFSDIPAAELRPIQTELELPRPLKLY
jgi:hypothetical protein